MNRIDASKNAVSRSILSVITSGSILTVVGYGLYFTSTVQGISEIGRLVARGAILSVLLVLSLLPALLCAFDTLIQKNQNKFYARQQAKAQKRKLLSSNNSQKEDKSDEKQ